MIMWDVVAGLVERMPPFLARRMPSRYSIQPGLRGAIRRARIMHLGSLLCLTLLLVAMMYREDTQTLAHLKKGVANHYLALLPVHPDGIGTDQLWDVITQLVTSAVLSQNITHNGTLKGVVSLRQFRLTQNQTRSFFPDCDFSRLDKEPLKVPTGTKVPSAWRYCPVRQVTQVFGHRCPYPPEGYNVYLGDLQDYVGNTSITSSGTNNTINLGIAPLEVLNESLWMLDDLQQHSWVDSLTMVLLLNLLAAQPGTATPAAITIIFENPVQFGGEDGNSPPRWWASYSLTAVDLRPNTVASVLLSMFLFVHLLVMWFETNVPIALMLTDQGETARRCITLATAAHVIILALHAGAVYLHFTASFEAQKEESRYYVSFDMRVNPEKFEYEHNQSFLTESVSIEEGGHLEPGGEPGGGREGIIPYLECEPDYKISVRQITLARIQELKTICWQLLSLEVMLYLVSFTLFREHYSETIQIAMRTIRSGMYRATALVLPLLALLVLASYLVHRAHPVRRGEDFHTFASAFKETVNAVLGAGKGADMPKTTMEWVMGVVLLVMGMLVTLLFWRVCLSPDESRAMRTQRLPLHPL